MSVSKAPHSRYVENLKAHWYESNGKGNQISDPLGHIYDPCYEESPRKCRRVATSTTPPSRHQLQTSLRDVIHAVAVLVYVESLTNKYTLPIAVQKKFSK